MQIQKVYLDNSVLNRPFDDHSIPNIKLEAMATLLILEFVENKKFQLVNSSVIQYENSKNPFFERKIWISFYLLKAHIYQKINIAIKKRAEEIEKFKIDPMDSLHLAVAEATRVDYFITCDYTLIRRYKGNLKVINPIKFCQLSL